MIHIKFVRSELHYGHCSVENTDVLTEHPLTPQMKGESPKSRIFIEAGVVDQLMGGVDHVQYFWSGTTLIGVADPP